MTDATESSRNMNESTAADALLLAIDGPSGTGKSTVSRAVAEHLGAKYLDTGAMYRVATLWVLRQGIDPADSDAVAAATADLPLAVSDDPRSTEVLLDGEDVSGEIRGPEVTQNVSAVSAIPAVRENLVDLQRRLAADAGRCVVEGRDIGTVVLPHADVKIFLTADAEVRAKRRYDELQQKGDKTPYAQILAETKQRDKQDSERAAAPLRQAADAVVLDTSGYTLEQSVEAILALVRRKLG